MGNAESSGFLYVKSVDNDYSGNKAIQIGLLLLVKTISLYKMCIIQNAYSAIGELITKQVITNGMHYSLARLPEKQLVIAFCFNIVFKKSLFSHYSFPPYNDVRTRTWFIQSI